MRQSLIFFTLILFSCESNWGKYGGYKIDYESELEYCIVLDKVDTVLKNYPYYNKGAFVKYYSNDNIFDTVFIGNGGTVIQSFVDHKNVYSDNKFIVLKQKPLKDICECNDSCLVYKYLNKNAETTYEICKDALDKSTIYQYWIIDKMKNTVYGPFKKEQYLQKRKELRVPNEIQLKE